MLQRTHIHFNSQKKSISSWDLLKSQLQCSMHQASDNCRGLRLSLFGCFFKPHWTDMDDSSIGSVGFSIEFFPRGSRISNRLRQSVPFLWNKVSATREVLMRCACGTGRCLTAMYVHSYGEHNNDETVLKAEVYRHHGALWNPSDITLTVLSYWGD